MHFVPDAPMKLKIAKGHYEAKGADGLVYTIVKCHVDWAAVTPDGATHAIEATMRDVLTYLADGYDDRAEAWDV